LPTVAAPGFEIGAELDPALDVAPVVDGAPPPLVTRDNSAI
jgi:hypothetical protein